MAASSFSPASSPLLSSTPASSTENMQPNSECGVFAVALTGGPSGGKTTAQTVLSDALENLGFCVFRVPETATLLLNCGVKFATLSEKQRWSFQSNLLLTLLQIEKSIFDLASIKYKESGQKCIVLCDRGAMDPSAYIDRKSWIGILNAEGLKEVDIRDNRYDLVLHLVTAADGAENFYTLANNSARSEDPQLARELDRLVMNAWVGHPCHVVIDNSTDFEMKCNRAVQAVLNRMGMVDKRAGKNLCKRKFIVKKKLLDIFPVAFRDFVVEHTYIKSCVSLGTQIRLRCRLDEFNCSHRNITIRHPPSEGQTIEERRSLSVREYDALCKLVDSTRQKVLKRRRCFVYKNFSFQLDTYESPREGLTMLEAYLPKDHDDVISLLPEFIEIEREVTNFPEFSMYNIAAKVKDDE